MAAENETSSDFCSVPPLDLFVYTLVNMHVCVCVWLSLSPYPGDGERHVEVLPSLQPEAPRRRAVQSHCVRARLRLHVGKRWEQILSCKKSAVFPVAGSWSCLVRSGWVSSGPVLAPLVAPLPTSAGRLLSR